MDAGYEGMKKRTFLVTIVLVILYIPFLLELLVLLYLKIGSAQTQIHSDKDFEEVREHLVSK